MAAVKAQKASHAPAGTSDRPRFLQGTQRHSSSDFMSKSLRQSGCAILGQMQHMFSAGSGSEYRFIEGRCQQLDINPAVLSLHVAFDSDCLRLFPTKPHSQGAGNFLANATPAWMKSLSRESSCERNAQQGIGQHAVHSQTFWIAWDSCSKTCLPKPEINTKTYPCILDGRLATMQS